MTIEGWGCISTSGDDAARLGHYGDCQTPAAAGSPTATISIDRP